VSNPCCREAARFYRIQLHRHSEAVAYLHQRGIRSQALIEHMRIGYAPGGCLRGWLTQLGHSLPDLRQAGVVTGVGYDAYVHRIVFPLEDNLYGRSLSPAAPPHRFLPGSKGGLYAWKQAQFPSGSDSGRGPVRLRRAVEAGFHNVTCSLGNHLNARQFRQLCNGPRTVYLTFDADGNGSGQQAAQCLSQRLRERGITPRVVSLPEGHDPNSFFVSGGHAAEFSPPVGGGLPVRFRVAQPSGLENARSPVPLSTSQWPEVEGGNRFLDQQRIRGVAETTLRKLCVRSAPFSALVGACNPYHGDHGEDAHRIHPARLYSFPNQSAAATCRRQYQPQSGYCGTCVAARLPPTHSTPFVPGFQTAIGAPSPSARDGRARP